MTIMPVPPATVEGIDDLRIVKTIDWDSSFTNAFFCIVHPVAYVNASFCSLLL